MGIFHIFKIIHMVPNRAKRHKYPHLSNRLEIFINRNFANKEFFCQKIEIPFYLQHVSWFSMSLFNDFAIFRGFGIFRTRFTCFVIVVR